VLDQQNAKPVVAQLLPPAYRSKENLAVGAGMNVWAIDKDVPLKLLLLELVHCYGENALALNNQAQHYKAIELCTVNDPDISAYIYTFGQNAGCYGIDLKYPISAHNIVGENENLSLDQIKEILSMHLFS
jgi:hypothetical protein